MFTFAKMKQRVPHVILNLLIINGLVYLFLILFPQYQPHFILYKYDLFGIRETVNVDGVLKYVMYSDGIPVVAPYGPEDFHWYQLITHFFSHIYFWHILFNMIALFSIGTPVEIRMRSGKFLAFYLFSGLFAGFVMAFLDPNPMPSLGASGAVSGVLAAFAYYFPQAQLMIFPIPIPISAKKLAIGFGIFSLAMFLFFPTSGGISHIGHLAGLLGGGVFLFVEHFRRKI